jgi:translation elongation factor EF-Tu-like GTPase
MKIEFRARLRLLRTDEGGRHSAISSGYRSIVDLGERTPAGETLWWGGEINLLEANELAPGEESEVCVRLWGGTPANLAEGAAFRLSEGQRLVGEGEVLTEPTPWKSPGNLP